MINIEKTLLPTDMIHGTDLPSVAKPHGPRRHCQRHRVATLASNGTMMAGWVYHDWHETSMWYHVVVWYVDMFFHMFDVFGCFWMFNHGWQWVFDVVERPGEWKSGRSAGKCPVNMWRPVLETFTWHKLMFTFFRVRSSCSDWSYAPTPMETMVKKGNYNYFGPFWRCLILGGVQLLTTRVDRIRTAAIRFPWLQLLSRW